MKVGKHFSINSLTFYFENMFLATRNRLVKLSSKKYEIQGLQARAPLALLLFHLPGNYI